MSMPFVNAEFVFTQPDGTRFRVRGTGDQHHAIFKTLDGYTVVRDQASGYYHYARLSDDGETLVPTGITAATAEPRLLDLNPNAQPPTIPGAGLPRTSLSRWESAEGSGSLQCIFRSPPIWRRHPDGPRSVSMSDCVFWCSFPMSQARCRRLRWRPIATKKITADLKTMGRSGTISSTIQMASLRTRTSWRPTYTTKHPRSYYTDEKIAYPGRAQELVGEVLAYHVASGFDFSHLSADSDHHIYAINVFYAGDVVNNYAQGLWPHSWHLSAPFNVGLGKLANDYQISNMGRS
jgi:hypothetical protein